MTTNHEEVFNWADYETPTDSTSHTVVEPYRPTPIPAVIPPIASVVQPAFGSPYYAHQPAQPLPAYDPLPARLAGLGIAGAGVGIGAGVAGVGVGFGADLLFTGMSHATSALIGLAAAFVAGAVMLLVLRSGSGVHIGHFHQGDGAMFRTGR